MDQTPRRPAPRPGLDPRDALDILDIRTREQQMGGGTNYLARRTDAGADVLQYLAQHGTPAVRASRRRQSGGARATNRLLADDDVEDVRAELAAKIARLMPGLSQREAPTFSRSPSRLWNVWRATPPSSARHPGGRDQASGLHAPRMSH